MSTNTKPLAGWTLGEAMEECAKHELICDGCSFYRDGEGCRLYHDGSGISVSWDIIGQKENRPG